MSDARTKKAGTRSGRRDQADRRREIVDAAAALFREKGYAGSSIQDVADAVNILKGSLYYYIKSKDDLLFAVVQEVHDEGLKNLEEGKQVDGSALERIRSFVERHMEFNARHLTKMTVFFHEFRSLSLERRAVIVEERDLYDQHLRGLITAGQEEGSVRADVDPAMAGFAILGSMNWMYQWYRPDGRKTIEEIAAEFAEMAVDSVREPSWTGSA